MSLLAIAGGAGAIGGRLLSGIGQSKGASAAARARGQQAAEQAAIQAEADRETAVRLGGIDPAAMDAQPGAMARTQAGHEQVVQRGRPGLAEAQAAANEVAPSATHGRRLAALGRQRALSATQLKDLSIRRAAAANRAARLAQGYDLTTNAAAQQGGIMRNVGGLLGAVGDAGLTAGMFSAGQTAGAPQAAAAAPGTSAGDYVGLGTGNNPWDYRSL